LIDMLVRKLNEVTAVPTSGGIFTGEVKIKRVFGADTNGKDLAISLVHFPSGVRNMWHVHDYEQCLWITEGRGKVATREKEVDASPGMAFLIHAGESHWHGSTGEAFSHISIVGGLGLTKQDAPNPFKSEPASIS